MSKHLDIVWTNQFKKFPRACRLMYGTTLLALLLGCAVRLLIFSL